MAGAAAATLIWASLPRTRRHMGGGFEGEGTDYTVLLTELPFAVAAGAALPALAWALLVHLMRRRRRPAAQDVDQAMGQGGDQGGESQLHE
ncbi:hypothetical protein [Streptomyces sp. NPDC050704]|uniref:hypothetical protein n=1 Tax=Streptomyces sp. NPDC050704 TaxID=3157219 RepID=UPI00341DD83E